MNQLNGMVQSLFEDLKEKRLWPVALALVVALIAIPLLLSKPAESTPSAAPVTPATPATGSGGSLAAFQPVVNTEGAKSSQIRKSLKGFNEKDPFKVQGLNGGGGGGGSSDAGSVQVADSSAGGSGDTSATGGSGGSSGSATPSPESTSQQESGSSGSGLQYFKFTVDVRFGKSTNPLDKKTLDQFRALPSSQNPVVVFMGVKTDGETAVFLVSSASSTTGEGKCVPDDTCTFLYMKAGEQQSFESVDGNDQVVTYVLKMLQVNMEKTDAPEAASSSNASRAATSRAQREGFTRRIGAVGF